MSPKQPAPLVGRFERWVARPSRTAAQWKETARRQYVSFVLMMVMWFVMMAFAWFDETFGTGHRLSFTVPMLFGVLVPLTAIQAFDARRNYRAALESESRAGSGVIQATG